MPGPFDLADATAYRRWRDEKLDRAPRRLDDLIVAVRDPRALSRSEMAAIGQRCALANMAIYASPTGGVEDKAIVTGLGRQFGMVTLDGNWLADDDGVSPLAVAEGGEDKPARGDFIPYTDKPIRWHTDGYYNPPERTVRGRVLQCVRRAGRGGENRLLDHEIAYILLRDADPAHVRALSAPDAMTIPARQGADGEARPDQPGPVFSVDAEGHLHMRYTARTRSIAWRDDAATRAAVATLEALLAGESPWTFRGVLEDGMGLICNNVLHDRAGFENSPDRARLLYRARYYERINACL